ARPDGVYEQENPMTLREGHRGNDREWAVFVDSRPPSGIAKPRRSRRIVGSSCSSSFVMNRRRARTTVLHPPLVTMRRAEQAVVVGVHPLVQRLADRPGVAR